MEIREIQNKEIWENFLLGYEDKTFLQSWNWGEFQKKNGLPAGRQGNRVWRLGAYDNGELFSVVLVSKISAKRGTFLLIQHGPNTKLKVKSEKLKVLSALLDGLKRIAKEEKCDFIRMAPIWERNEENNKIFKDLGFREASMHANAYEATLKLDLRSSEQELLMNMRKTTRYLIRQAMKNPDITIEKSPAFASSSANASEDKEATAGKDKIEDIKIFNKLTQEIAERQKFVPFSSEYIKNEFEVFSKDNEALLFFGKYKGELAAAALVVFWSDIGFYHQAASSEKYAKFSIPYLILWKAIKEAKKRGCTLFDFWGYVDPKNQPKHPWAGPTLFKMGFGGKAYEYVKTQDYPLSKKYWLTYLFEKLRKIKRGL